MFDHDPQGYNRHERNKRFMAKLLKLLRKPYIFLPLGAFIFYIWWKAQPVDSVNAPLIMSVFWIFAGLSVILMMVSPFYFIFKASQTIGRRLAERNAVHVPRDNENREAINFIQQNYKTVFANIGLVLRDDQKTAQLQAGAAAASLYGRSRVAQLGASGALAADAYINKQVPSLVQIIPVDEYKTEMLFLCPAGITVGAFDDLSDEIASGFRVPRVSASQDSFQRSRGLVELDIFHRDVLEENETFDTEDWFEDE